MWFNFFAHSGSNMASGTSQGIYFAKIDVKYY